MKDGYRIKIDDGIAAVKHFKGLTSNPDGPGNSVDALKGAIESADRIVVGAGAGLSTAAGLTYSGERFLYYFPDFASRFGITDMYSGGFYRFPTDRMFWAWWSRHIYVNRYVDPPNDTYSNLLSALEGKDYFVVTTNVDHQFQRAGFDKDRLFYTQGDYGLFQRADGKGGATYDNEDFVMSAMESQGFVRNEEGVFVVPKCGRLFMEIPGPLIPHGPSGERLTMNLRSDDSFVEDEGWRRASDRYARYLEGCMDSKTLFLEIGVGFNTPAIIKYPFWQMVRDYPEATYACINFDEAACPMEISHRSICLKGDASSIIRTMSQKQ